MSSKVAALYIRVSTEDQTELSPDAGVSYVTSADTGTERIMQNSIINDNVYIFFIIKNLHLFNHLNTILYWLFLVNYITLWYSMVKTNIYGV